MIIATHGILASQIASFTGLLDLYPNAEVAFSLRKLRNAYSGSAIQVRRSSDNTTQNIGFVNNVLDTSALTTFCGSANGFITTWYDQSGNGRNAIQTTAANQPQIVSSGSIININSKPSLKFDGSNSCLLGNYNLTITSQSTFGVFNYDNGSTLNAYSRIYTQANSGNDYDTGSYIPIIRLGSVNTIGSYQNGDAAGITISYNSQSLFSSIHSGSLITNTYNNSTSNTSSKIHNYSYTRFSLGRQPAGTGDGNLLGNIQEIIMYTSNQTSNISAINSNINTYYGIY